jgi:hypothetical protein
VHAWVAASKKLYDAHAVSRRFGDCASVGIDLSPGSSSSAALVAVATRHRSRAAEQQDIFSLGDSLKK